MTRAENSRSSATEAPTTRGSDHASPCSAMIPRCTNEVVSLAFEEAKRRSQFIAATNPMPAQAPLIAAMIGFGMDRGNVNGLRRCGLVVAPVCALSASTLASMPGQKLRPAPVTTMTRTASSSPHSSSRR